MREKKKRNKCWVLSMVASLYRKHELYAKVIATLQNDEVFLLEGVHVCNPRCPRNVDCADVGLECERMKSHRQQNMYRQTEFTVVTSCSEFVFASFREFLRVFASLREFEIFEQKKWQHLSAEGKLAKIGENWRKLLKTGENWRKLEKTGGKTGENW